MLRDVKSWLVIVCHFAFTSIRFYFKPDFEEGRKRQAFESGFCKVGATRERYFANIADNKRCEGIKLSNPKQ